jgi:hypothetical protein
MRPLRFGIRFLLAPVVCLATLAARDLPPQNPPGTSVQTDAATPGSGLGLLMGTVVDPLTDQPVPGSLVMLGGGITPMGSAISPQFFQETLSSGNRLVLTDGQGRFMFSDLPKGTYTISVSKAGYTNGAYGRRRPLGPPQVLPLADGERIGDLKVPIWKNATITGAVTDESGDPIVEGPVEVLLWTLVAGRRKLSLTEITKTDDRGFYRVTSLTPGEYVVAVPSTQMSAPESIVDLVRQAQAAPPGAPSDYLRELASSGTNSAVALGRSGGLSIGGLAFQSLSGSRFGATGTVPTPPPAADGRLFVYPTEYYAAAMTAAQATAITLRSGEDRGGVDLQLKLVPTSRVSGTVTGPDGPASVGLSLVPNTEDLSTDMGFETAATVSDATGRFTFLGVPAGQYTLRVNKVPPAPMRGAAPFSLTGPTLWATLPISVDASDVQDVAVTLRTGFHLAGRLAFDDPARQPTPELVQRMLATFESADGRPFASPFLGRSQFSADGQFSSAQLPPGQYYLRVNNLPAGWTLKGAMFEGHDISDVPLSLDHDVSEVVVTLTDHPCGLNGRVQGLSGARDAGATVLLFPSERVAWIDYGSNPRRLRSIRTDKDGAFQTTGLPAGDYLVAAIADETAVNWQDPRILQALVRVATPVKLGDGETRSVELHTVVPPR